MALNADSSTDFEPRFLNIVLREKAINERSLNARYILSLSLPKKKVAGSTFCNTNAGKTRQVLIYIYIYTVYYSKCYYISRCTVLSTFRSLLAVPNSPRPRNGWVHLFWFFFLHCKEQSKFFLLENFTPTRSERSQSLLNFV